MIRSATTEGIVVEVEPIYLHHDSRPAQGKFMHTYNVCIKNTSDKTVQLIRRHWIIKNGDGRIREVNGEGVIGLQPILGPGEEHKYHSWSPISAPLGKMWGRYYMKDLETNTYFWIDVPEFELVAPFKLN